MIDYIDVAVGAAVEETEKEVPSVSLLPWPTLPVRASSSERWMHEQPPSELEDVIADEGSPSELLDIIRWSLQRRPPRPATSTCTSPTSRTSRQSGVEDAGTTPPTSPDSWASCVALTQPIATDMSAEHASVSPESSSSPANGHGQPLSVFARLMSRVLPSVSTYAHLNQESDEAGSLKRTLTLPSQPATTECISCFDEIARKEATKLSCTHSYCPACFTTLVMTAIQTETAFPPRCCLTEIPLKTIIAPLSQEQKELYGQKAAEYATEPKNRWYCHRATCGRWIPPSKLSELRTISTQKCPYCAAEQCLICRGDPHPTNTGCPQDFGLEATLREAESRGYKRCYRCSTLVELTGGCRHMTCTCGAEFCFVCGLKWRTCSCSTGDHTRQQAEIRQRREQREQQDAAGRAEEEEIARAIAQVEALIEQDRQEAEKREAKLREAEEMELALLESMRLQELEQQRKDDEEMERQRVDMLRASIGDRLVFLQTELQNVVHYQQSALVSRRESELHALKVKHEDDQTVSAMELESLHVTLTANMERRKQALGERHAIERTELITRQQDEEDDIRTWAHLKYKDKPNGEARERRQIENVVHGQTQARQKLEKRHQRELKTLQQNFDVEMRGLDHSKIFRQESAAQMYRHELSQVGRRGDADRKWTEFILDRRNRLLSEHGRLLRVELDAGADPVGLTEARAWEVMPPWPQPAPPSAALNRCSQAQQVLPEVCELPSTSAAGATSPLTPAPLFVDTKQRCPDQEALGGNFSPQSPRPRRRGDGEHFVTAPSSFDDHEIRYRGQRYYENNHLVNAASQPSAPSQSRGQPQVSTPTMPTRSTYRHPKPYLPQKTAPLSLYTLFPSSSSTTITQASMSEQPGPSSSTTSSWSSLPQPPTPSTIDRITHLADSNHNGSYHPREYVEPHPGTPWSPTHISLDWNGFAEEEAATGKGKGKQRQEEELPQQEERRGSHERMKALHWRLRRREKERVV